MAGCRVPRKVEVADWVGDWYADRGFVGFVVKAVGVHR